MISADVYKSAACSYGACYEKKTGLSLFVVTKPYYRYLSLPTDKCNKRHA